MIVRTVRSEFKPERLDCPSMDEWILSVEATENGETLDTLSRQVPNTNWAQFLLTIDRLSRNGKVALWPLQHGDYRIMRKGPT